MKEDSDFTPEQYRVMHYNGTEQKYSGKYYKHFVRGIYNCLLCDSPIAPSRYKLDTDFGWATFSKPENDTLIERPNVERGYTERFLYCSRCGIHTGHIHTLNKRDYYLLNSNSIEFTAE